MFRVQKYYLGTAVSTEAEREARDKRPPGLYKCPECRDTTIIWRTAVDKYKVKCTKCNADMTRVKLVPKAVPLVTAFARLHMSKSPAARKTHDLLQVKLSKLKAEELSKKNELDELAEIYASDPLRARLEAARAGVPLCQVAFHYGKGTALTGLELGKAHGKAEAAGTRGAPGALKLWLLQKLHGGSYVVGRQKGLSGKHGGTRSAASIIDALPALLKEAAGGKTQTQA